ncbi:hypothetical protein Tco_1261052, partial [Tanacetum coccineum]
MFESGTYKSLPEHVALYEALEVSMKRANRDKFFAEKDKSRKRRKKNKLRKRRCNNQDPPHPPPDLDLTRKTSDTREAPLSSSKQQSGPYSEQLVKDVPMPDTAHISDSEDTNSAHLPKIKLRPEWLRPIPEEDIPATREPDWVIPPNELPKPKNNLANALANSFKDPGENKLLRKTGDMGSFITWFCKRIGKKKLSHRLVPDVSKPLPLGGPPGQVTIQSQYFFNKDMEYLVSGDKGRRSALSISKLKAAQYLDFGLEELVPSLWIKSEREYDISAAYVSLKTLERYGYTYLKEIVLRRANYKEYKISEGDFKNLHPNDFEDLYLLHLQGQLNHLSGDDKVHLFNAVNLWIRNIVIRKRVEDLQLRIEISKPREIIYRDNDQRKMMRETEVHKFSDGTLNRILDKLDHIVKEFKLY